MKLLVIFAAVAVVFVGALPVFENVQELGDLPSELYEQDIHTEDNSRYRRSAYEEYVEDIPLEEELPRQRRSLSETDFEEIPFEEELPRQRRSLSETDFKEIRFEDMPEQGLRYKRATCDALSFSSKWLTVNHSACAIHCIAKGFRGGKCVNTICNCRR